MKPFVTILMPVYNAEKYVADAISSILNQTYSNFEFLIINDASTDNSEKIIQSFADSRIRYIKNEINLRLVATLNKGLSLIQTPYIARMDADDLSHPTRLEKLIKCLTENSAVDFLSSSLELFGSETGIWSLPLSDDECKSTLIFRSCLNHAATIYKKSFLDKHNLAYREKHVYMEDYDLWYRAFRCGVKFMNIEETLYSYRREDHNITIQNKATSEERLKLFYEEILSDLDIAATPYQLDLHCRLRFLKAVKAEDILNYKKWLDLLNRKNDELLVYPKGTFNSVLREEWNKLFYFILNQYPEFTKLYFKTGGIKVRQLYYLFKTNLNKKVKLV